MTTIVVSGDKPTLQTQLMRLADAFTNSPAGTLVEVSLHATDKGGNEVELRFSNERQMQVDKIEVEVQ